MSAPQPLTIRSGMVFENAGPDRAKRGHRQIVVASVYPSSRTATVQDTRTDHGWRMSVTTLQNPDRWTYTGANAWTAQTRGVQ